MIDGLPLYISLIFSLTTLAVFLLIIIIIRNSGQAFSRKRSLYVALLLTVWLALQAVLDLQGVYRIDNNAFPPKLVVFGVLPAIGIIVLLFLSKGGRRFMDSLPLAQMTWLHTIRIPVEIVLFWLFLNHVVPQLMTFEGRNFDIIAGITAPVVAYWGISKQKMTRPFLLLWNIVCLVLLFNIVILALLSAPTPIQRLAFDEPNIAIFHFPFVWLPTFIVPAVLAAHLISIKRLMKK